MFKRFLYIFLFLLAGVAAFAQQYPVQGSLAIASPYPANLSDYANSNIQNVVLNLTLTDLNMANKRVRLKVFIQTQNATIAQSIDNVSGEPLIMLDGGIPQRFTNAELAHYFRLENLQGINPDGYARSLPEGVYTISFEVYDYFTGNKLSGRIGQTFWIIINDPPLLNTPADKSKIADFTSGSRGTGGIIFNWTPRSTQVSNTEYEFTLCELWDATGDAYQQFMSAIPKYQTTVSNSTTLIYTMAQPSLISGYTYAWRVRAKAKAGFEDVGLYRNDGYSNLFTFRYGDPCPAPQSLTLEAKTSDAIAATWDAPIGATTGGISYKIAYRKYSAAGQWSWAETETSDLFRTISDLEPATEYEIKVGVPCNQTNEVVYTTSQRAITLAAGQISGIECGKEPTIDLSKQTLLMLLKAGDVVMANDFPTTISSVTGTSQGWSGEAWTKVPWLGDTRIHVTYASIKVNSDYKLIDGSFITTYDPTGKNIGDIDKTIDDAVGLVTGGTDVGKVVTGDAATTYTVPYTITPADTVGSTFTANTTGGGTITLGNGQTLTVSNLPTTVQDAAGTVYQADDKGKLTKVGTSSSNAGAMLATANLTVVDASKGTVTFAPTSNMKYAFDAWQKAYDGNSAWSKRYETLPLSGGAKGGAYRVSSKLMVPGEADKVLAIINLNDKSIAAGSVQFVNAKGTVFEKDSITPTSYKINLVGGPAGDAQEVYALYSTGGKTYTLGKLLVATYEPKTINLALVPVNDAPLDSKAIAAELKKVYEPLGINFNLTPKDNFKYKALETASLKVEGSGLLSVYTEQMKALNAAFVAKGEYDKNTIYLFAIDQPESQDGKSIEGVMPRGQQFGYMFVKGKDGDEQGLTAAHEIGHGVFQLQHAFEYSGIKQKAISPLNVMDYPAGEALSKLQWDLMHDQGLVISVFETDKGVMIQKYLTRQICIDKTISDKILKKPYLLGANGRYFESSKVSEIKSLVYEDTSKNPAPVGSVAEFIAKDDGKTYKIVYYTSSNKFAGYKQNSGDEYDKITTNEYFNNKKSESASITINKANCKITIDGGQPIELSKVECDCGIANYDNLNAISKKIYDSNKNKVDASDYDILLDIAKIGEGLNDELYDSFVSKQENDGSLFWKNINKSADYSRENLTNTLKVFKAYTDAIKKLNEYAYKTCDELVLDVKTNFQITKGSNNPFVFPSDMKMVQIIKAPFRNLTLERKKVILDLLYQCAYPSTTNVGTDVNAGTILSVIFQQSNKSSGANTDEKALIDYIVAKHYLKHFVEDLYGYQYECFTNALFNIVLKNYDYTKFSIGNPASTPNSLTFSTAYLKRNSEEITSDGKVKLQLKNWFSENNYPIECQPYAPISVQFANDVDFGNSLKFKKGECKVLPAIMVYQLFWDDTKAARWKSARITLDVALTTVGIGEIAIAADAYRAGRTAYATYVALKSLGDVGVGLTDIVLQNSDYLDNHPDFTKYWNKFVLLYTAGSLSATGIEKLADKYGGKIVINSQQDAEKFYKAAEDAGIDVEQALAKSDDKDEIEKLIDYAGADDLIGLKLPRYPANNFLEYVNTNFTTQEKKYFEEAKSFYLKNVSNFNINHLRGIDFSQEVKEIEQSANTKMYQVARLDDNGDLVYGSYYFNDINEDVTKLGIGDMNKIIKDEKILIEVTFNKETEFLKSRSVNIEDWNDTGEVFEGGVIQYFNNKAKSNIDKSLTKVIKRYGQ